MNIVSHAGPDGVVRLALDGELDVVVGHRRPPVEHVKAHDRVAAACTARHGHPPR
jgi:hypothetical protein